MTKVRTIKRHNKSTLVEYVNKNGVLERRFIPSGENVGDVSDETLDMGISYGNDFHFKDRVIHGKDLKRELNRRGVWVTEDLIGKPEVVNAAILYLVKITTRSLILDLQTLDEEE